MKGLGPLKTAYRLGHFAVFLITVTGPFFGLLWLVLLWITILGRPVPPM